MKCRWGVGFVVWAACLLACAATARPEERKFICSRDVWVSAVGEEVNHSMGKTPTMKIKTIQEMAILDFDLSELKGKVVGDGYLYFNIVHDPEEIARHNLPFPRKHLLRRIGLSTVSTDWVEGNASGSYTVDESGFGATFLEASYSKKPWSFPGSDLSDVTFGNGNTLQHHTELEEVGEDGGIWARVKVPAYMIQALIARDGFGWCIMDEIGYGLANNFIHSREAPGKEPYLVVSVRGNDVAAPATPRVSVEPAPDEAHMGKGAVAVDIVGAAETFCYFVTVNGREVPRWMIPHPVEGKARVVVDSLRGGEQVAVEVVAADAAGNRSAPAKAEGTASPSLASPPTLPEAWKPTPGEPPVRGGKLRVWAFPEVCKVRYTNGSLFEAGLIGADAESYRQANSVWDGATNTVRLFGARGEIVAFQLCLERVDRDRPLEDVSIRISGLTGPGRIDADHIRLFRVWYVKLGEYAVPLSNGQTLSIPAPDNKLRGQNNQSVYVDVAIPGGARPGTYRGTISISAKGVARFSLPVKLLVYDFDVPKAMRFNPELNIYQSPGRPGSKTFFEAYRLAHYDRCTLSITQAGHGDGVKTPLPISGSGAGVRVSDWSGWDNSFGRLLDGSAFADLPRSGEPLPTCQIPLSHGYPLPLDRYYSYSGPKHGQGIVFIHALTCKPIHEAFSPAYKAGWMNFARQIVLHAERKGWTRTQFLFYMDAKPNYRATGSGTSYWILDEPYNYDDWMALRFWGQMFQEAIKPVVKRTHFGYRCDISRPGWTRDWLHGIMTHMYVGGLTRKVKRCQIMAEEGPMVFYSYGACNNPKDSHWNSVAWCLQTYLAGGDGVLPWQSIRSRNAANSLWNEDQQGLILLGVLGRPAIGSIRLKALRRGAQDCEYLITLAEKYRLNREQLRAMVAAKIPSKATYRQKFEDEAAAVTFSELDPAKFAELREGVAKLIEQGQ